jgi:hypothetical protein
VRARLEYSQHECGMPLHYINQIQWSELRKAGRMETKVHKSRHSEKGGEYRHKSHKRKKRDSERDESRKSKGKRRKESSQGVTIVDDDVDDDDLWVEKTIDNVTDTVCLSNDVLL